MGLRAGFVYKTEDDLITNNISRDARRRCYTVPYTFNDIGVDGRADTADDRQR